MNEKEITTILSEFRQGNYTNYPVFISNVMPLVNSIVSEAIGEGEEKTKNITEINNRIYNNVNKIYDAYSVNSFVCAITTHVLLESGNLKTDFSYFESTDENVICPESIFEDDENIVPENLLLNHELLNLLHSEIAKLPYEYKIVMQFYYCEGLNVAEISDKLQCRKKAVRNIVKYLRDIFIYYVSVDSKSTGVAKTMLRNISVFFAMIQTASGMKVTNSRIVNYSEILATSVTGAAIIGANIVNSAKVSNAVGSTVSGGTPASLGGAASGSEAVALGKAAIDSTAGAVGSGAGTISGSVGSGMATSTSIASVGTATSIGSAASVGTAASTAVAIGSGISAIKIGAVIISAAVAIGTGVAVYKHNTSDDSDDSDSNNITTEAPYTIEDELSEDDESHVSETDITENENMIMFEEETFYLYLENALAPELGIFDKEEVINLEEGNYVPASGAGEGIVGVVVDYLDNEGAKEMVVFYVKHPGEVSDNFSDLRRIRDIGYISYEINEEGRIVEKHREDSLVRFDEMEVDVSVGTVTGEDGSKKILINYTSYMQVGAEPKTITTSLMEYKNGKLIPVAEYFDNENVWPEPQVSYMRIYENGEVIHSYEESLSNGIRQIIYKDGVPYVDGEFPISGEWLPPYDISAYETGYYLNGNVFQDGENTYAYVMEVHKDGDLQKQDFQSFFSQANINFNEVPNALWYRESRYYENGVYDDTEYYNMNKYIDKECEYNCVFNLFRFMRGSESNTKDVLTLAIGNKWLENSNYNPVEETTQDTQLDNASDAEKIFQDVNTCSAIKTSVETGLGNESIYEYLCCGETYTYIYITPTGGEIKAEDIDIVGASTEPVGANGRTPEEVAEVLKKELIAGLSPGLELLYQEPLNQQIGTPVEYVAVVDNMARVYVYIATNSRAMTVVEDDSTGTTSNTGYQITPNLCEEYDIH